ncbi:TPA: hypothetical protein L4Q98_005837 [Pseudomonas aeruginosa]|nr:hypothetical protein [Pseudomonas aeruginosa]MBG7023708.1 hypothetical protein [Pseudomonas aeruginosa]MBG7370054.1 hypothetical protein [Pseudomonas aeruginosa]HBO3027804.1 hypothetical protein [Pseudomonas aeruginosa]HCR1591851.1 hypothetical protein [Pseudomonas aeruginosa]
MLHEPEEYRLFSLWMLVFMAIGWLGGWIHAHYTVAEECRKLGKFYVGKTVFECKAITEEDKENGNG